MAKEIVSGTHKTGKGNWDGMHKFGSGDGTWANFHGWAQFGTKGGGNGIVPKALKDFYKKYNLNPCITAVKLTVDPVKYTVDYEFTIEESPDGNAYVGFSSWGGASGGYPKKLKPASHAYPNYKKEYNGAKKEHPGTKIADVIDFYYPGGFRQIFFQFTWPDKYPNLPKSPGLKEGTVGVKIGPSGSPEGLPEYNGVLVQTTSVGLTTNPVDQSPTALSGTGSSASVINSGTPSIALNIVFPDNFEIKAREDVPKFTIWVGDPQPQEQVEGFSTFFEDGQQVDEFGNPIVVSSEYEEVEYFGTAEDIEEREANQVEDEPIGPIATTTGDGTTTSGTTEVTNVDVGSTPIGPGPPAGSKLVVGSGKSFYINSSSLGLAGHRLKNIIPDLQKHLNANGFSGTVIKSNGIMRDIVGSTYPDNPKRAVASLHGAGLAVDVTFNIPGKKWKSISDNGNLASDSNLNKAIWNFVKAQGDITWGAEWGKSKPWDGLVQGWGITEYHHFEIKSKLISQYWKPFEKDLKAMGFDYTKLNTVGREGRIYPLFKAILNSKGIA